MVKTGLDRVLEWITGSTVPAEHRETADLLRKGKLGLLTNPSAVTRDLRSAVDALPAAGARLKALFGPEHGIRGDAPDGAPVPHGSDRRTGLPVWSLYGDVKAPTPEMLAGLDALLFDVQDVGARFYTFGSTLSYAMQSADKAGIPVIVLDRPNPIGGSAMEGPVLEPSQASFVGLYPIPVRHAATLAELGRLWSRFGAGKAPLAVPCAGWRRKERWERTGLQWVPPSPAMPTPETALVYPGTCWLEGSNVSEGRGTSRPFHWFGAPWVDAETLCDALNSEHLPGCRFRPVRFRPTASKFAGETCSGCHLHVTDPDSFRPVITGYAVLATLRRLHSDRFEWRKWGEVYSIDRLSGTASVRSAVEAGREWQSLDAEWRKGIEPYAAMLEEERIYG